MRVAVNTYNIECAPRLLFLLPGWITFGVTIVLLGHMAASAQDKMPVAELLTPVSLPKQFVAKEGHVKVAGAILWYWDTGGDGPAVVLVHPGTGSGLVWGYQQPVFAKAGYRVIG